jgi:uncharacterized protein
MQLRSFGDWAVVTGGTSGIGSAFADLLAAEGFNLLLVSRDERALERKASELRQRFGIVVEVLSVDLAAPDAAARVFDRAVEVDAGVVISNAGFGGLGGFFSKSLADHHRVFRLNGLVNVDLAFLFGRHFQTRAKRGAILLTGSTVGLHGTPFAGTYSASKASTIALAEALNFELLGTGVHFSAMSPGVTDTPAVQSNPDADLSHLPMKPMSPIHTAQEGLAALRANKAHHVAGAANRLMTGLVGRRILSRGASVRIWGSILRRLVIPSAASHRGSEAATRPAT